MAASLSKIRAYSKANSRGNSAISRESCRNDDPGPQVLQQQQLQQLGNEENEVHCDHLKEFLSLRNFKLHGIPPGDGNCFFWSLKFQLAGKGCHPLSRGGYSDVILTHQSYVSGMYSTKLSELK